MDPGNADALVEKQQIFNNNATASIEAGFLKYLVEGWFSIVGPKGMGTKQVKRIHSAIATAFATPEVKEAMVKQGNSINVSSPEAALLHFKSELVKYAALVKRAGVVAQ
jgi:tripartite-type tricarboxylate transporter receptor subunit TctC